MQGRLCRGGGEEEEGDGGGGQGGDGERGLHQGNPH